MDGVFVMGLDAALVWLHETGTTARREGEQVLLDPPPGVKVPSGLTGALRQYTGDFTALARPASVVTDTPREDASPEWTPPVRAWPAPLAADAFHGLPGTFLRIVSPHTEADDAALLLQFLTAAGCLIGRGPHVPVEADHHGTNLFLCLVGDSAKGRKGTSWGYVRGACERVDPDWAGGRVMDGIGSGQALIETVRDARRDVHTGEVTDPGVTDKRLLVQAPEFAGLLAAQRMEGSTLSAVLRNAWDSGRLQVQTRTNPLMATGRTSG